MAGEYWEGKEYSFFSHKECEFRATKVQTHRILIACFVIVHYMPWEISAEGILNIRKKA